MGFAKYQEDIVSRYVGDLAIPPRQDSCRVS